MATKFQHEITDEEIDALVAAVSDELGPIGDDVTDDDDFDIGIEKEPLPGLETGGELVTPESTEDTAITVADNSCDPSGKKTQIQITENAVKQKPLVEATSPDAGISANNSVQVKTSDCSQTPCDASIEKYPGQGAKTYCSNEPNASSSQEQAVSHPADDAILTERVVTSDEKSPKKCRNVEDAKQKLIKSQSGGGGGGWGWGSLTGWGTSVISSATAITSHVGESLYNVLEKVESTLVEPEDNNIQRNVATVKRAHLNEKNQNQAKSDAPLGTKQLRSPGSAVKECLPNDQQQNMRDDDSAAADSATQQHVAVSDDADSSAEGTALQQSKKMPRTDSSQAKSRASDNSKKAADSCDSEGAQSVAANEDSEQNRNTQGDHDAGWFTGWNLTPLTHLTGAVKNTGKKVVTTGLGVIGEIGKKTYSVLMEDDAEEDAEKEKSPGARRSHLSSSSRASTFVVSQDDGTGEAHMDALQELSQWSHNLLTKQAASVQMGQADALRDDLAMIQEAFSISGIEEFIVGGQTEHDFDQLLKDFVSQLGLKLNVDKLANVQQKSRSYFAEISEDVENPKEVHQRAVKQLAEFTSAAIAMYHKIGQLLLVEASVPLLAYKFRSLSIAGLTKVLCVEIWIESNRFTRLLNDFASKVGDERSEIAAKSLATMVELEASNCSLSLQDACGHLLPIMQLVVARTHPQLTDCSGVAPHMESLQMCSTMSRTNVRDFVRKLPQEMRLKVENELATVESVFDLGYFQLDDDSDSNGDSFDGRVTDLIKLLVNEVDPTASKLIATQQHARKYVADCTTDGQEEDRLRPSARDIHQVAVQLLSEMTANSIEMFYAIAQLVLVENPHNRKLYAQKAENLASLTKVLCIEIGNLSTHFTHCLSNVEGDGPEAVTPFLTNVYLEASSSSTYIQDGFHLLLPVFQLAVVKAYSTAEESANVA